MKKKTAKNGKSKNRIKGWNGISPFKLRTPRRNEKPHTKKPDQHQNSIQPMDKQTATIKDQIANNPYARRAVTEIVKGIKGQER